MAQQLTGTLANFIVRIRRYLREEDSTISQWTNDFLQQIFNTNYRLRCSDLIMAHEGFFVIVGTLDVVENQGRYAWPTGFVRLLKMELVRDDGRRVPIQREERHYNLLPTASSGGDDYMPTYRPVGSGFVLEPEPLQAVTQGLQLEWNGVPEELTADDDTMHSDFPAMFDELVVLDTAITAMDQEGLQETATQTSGFRTNLHNWLSSSALATAIDIPVARLPPILLKPFVLSRD